MRERLIRLAIKYHGDYKKIRKAIDNKEYVSNSIALQKAITILDEQYPKQLLQLEYPPLVLFYEGDITLLKKDIVAVVGSREVSKYGYDVTKEIVNTIKRDYVIVSGLAKGVDALAHVEANNTIGVIGNGLNYIYPKENAELYDYMKRYQLIITEYPADERCKKYYFPFRNRIIAALANKIIITQAKKKSGTMLTVNEGLLLDKEIYAVVYPYDTTEGDGCNQLIEQGALMITKDNLSSLFDKSKIK